MKYSISLNKKTKKITVKRINNNIRLQHSGLRGPQGIQGDIGIGLPVGGNIGEIIVKASNDDYDFTYAAPNSLADKTYTQTFTTLSTVIVPHNLNKYPATTVIDSAGDEVEGIVEYTDLNNLTLVFSAPFSGRVSCN